MIWVSMERAWGKEHDGTYLKQDYLNMQMRLMTLYNKSLYEATEQGQGQETNGSYTPPRFRTYGKREKSHDVSEHK